MPCFTAMRAEIALMSGSAFAVTHHAFSSGAGRTSDGNGSHASTLKSPSYTKSVSWQHYHLSKLRVSRYRFVLQHYFYYIHSKHITSCFIFVDDVLSCLQRLNNQHLPAVS
ncbi:putative transposase [Shigella flexneri K-227]|uniref:Putative transposase n=1 Tax=Shigella flexneri K-227 TaxID=766147 RepID=F5NUG2_SHIFL|nr:putative transposase [Shigella flexneri K-272]EGK37984.1 putative transposase [Shigella flexneri K-227]